MSPRDNAGAAIRWLCLPFALALLAACGSSTAEVKQKPAQGGPEELNNLVEATKHHPSLMPGLNEAGPPIHVDPYPQSAGTAHNEHAPAHSPTHKAPH